MIRRRWTVSTWSSSVDSNNPDNLVDDDYLHSSFRKLNAFNVAFHNLFPSSVK
jgi:hypothetical protein